MRPQDLQLIGNELALKWPDGSEAFIPLEKLRRACPCAGCQGEVDVLGQRHQNPAAPPTAKSFELIRLSRVGGYGLQPAWADGHEAGIYSFDYLRQLAAAK